MTKKALQFVTAYGGHDKVEFNTTGESLAQQHFQKECDIKEIIKRNDRAGIIEHVNRGVAQYADVSEVGDYKDALEVITKSMESFMGLPSDIRKKFNNDPGEFFDFATNPDNAGQMVELGLAPSPAPAVSGKEAKASTTASPEPVDPDVSEG